MPSASQAKPLYLHGTGASLLFSGARHHGSASARLNLYGIGGGTTVAAGLPYVTQT